MDILQQVTEVRVLDGYRLGVTFDDGVSGVVDVSTFVASGGPIFGPLQNRALFEQVRVKTELGTIYWPNGADIAPETLYELVIWSKAVLQGPSEAA